MKNFLLLAVFAFSVSTFANEVSTFDESKIERQQIEKQVDSLQLSTVQNYVALEVVNLDFELIQDSQTEVIHLEQIVAKKRFKENLENHINKPVLVSLCKCLNYLRNAASDKTDPNLFLNEDYKPSTIQIKTLAERFIRSA